MQARYKLRGGDMPVSKSSSFISLNKMSNIYLMVLVKWLYVKSLTKRTIITERSITLGIITEKVF